MKPATKWALATTLVAMSGALAVAGYGLVALMAGLVLPAERSPVVVAAPAVTLVDLSLVGVILVLLGLLSGVLLQRRTASAPGECREARLLQDLYRGFARMDERVETLEAVLLNRAGKLFTVRRVN